MSDEPDDPPLPLPDAGPDGPPGGGPYLSRPESPFRRERRVAAEGLAVRRSFFGALASSTRRETVTTVLLGANVAVFAAMVVTGVGLFEPSVESLLNWGALRPLLVRDGEPWRLLTACFLHIGIIHLAVNMFSLWSLRFVEAWFGHLGFGVLYFASGLCGSLASTWWSDPFIVGAGASGALFGILGAVLGATFRWKRLGVPSSVTGPMFKGVINTLLLNGVIMLSIRNLDHAAHAGGFLSGTILGYVLAHAPTLEGVAGRKRRGWLTAAASAVVVTGVMFALARPGLAAAGEQVETVRGDEDAMELWSQTATPADAQLAVARDEWLPYVVGRIGTLREIDATFPSLHRVVGAELRRYEGVRDRLTARLARAAPRRPR
jgi:rhomboid protease GluP